MYEFDEDALLERLGALPARLRVVFAAACAERLLPAYSSFRARHGGRRSLEQALEGVWLNPDPQGPSDKESAEIELMEALVPQEGGFVGPWDQQATNAQNAGMATIYALRTRLAGDAQEAAWAARVAYEALDNFVINREETDLAAPGAEARTLSNALIQAELMRQHADLDDLEGAAAGTQAAVIDRVHARARADAARFFGA